MKQIVTSLLDDDLYKFTMQQTVFHQYPNAMVEYKFKCRNANIPLSPILHDVWEEILAMKDVKLTSEEAAFLRSLPFIRDDYVDWLMDYRYNPHDVDLYGDEKDLYITIRGRWLTAILWEVKLLYIVNELYFRKKLKDDKTLWKDNWKQIGLEQLNKKLDFINGYNSFKFADFGTRRRFSKAWHERVIKKLKKCPNFVGTSNVDLARRYNLRTIGTMAHEYIMAHLGFVDKCEVAQKRALHVWLQEYGSKLGIALTDTFTSDAFFNDFGVVLAREYDGVRHDSGDPIEFGEKVIRHYSSLGIDPRTKTIVFSDGLDFPKAIEIWQHFAGRVTVSFGIGTNLTNDVGVESLNIVIKMSECNYRHVVKLSDNKGKTMGDPEMVDVVIKKYKLQGR